MRDRRQLLKWVGLGTAILIIPVVGTAIWKWVQATDPVPRELNLNSEIGIDYTRLSNLLAVRNWEEADQETYQVMNKALNSNWSIPAFLNFPCTDLHTIEQLWVKHSNGHFGFSVQKKIYESVGGQSGSAFIPLEVYEELGDRVGWRVNSSWIDTFTFDTSAPIGHLPSRYGKNLLERLFSRIETCKL
ncbi:GUN4 domain-containing protein [Nodularia sp. UHCC 0506]|uniref:GUN4 domain-containing protein n=1 Tax=Nodularia sp. UHCC 0506 TaxID=3110243 RepID=UPI002B20169A|nr:GUN4 domain-containing protein [Nodularia sp. UHCC 0506]MEA5514565.1 GUN4 domain-containing protein [Nodularia sp. UHCC 0506]